MKRFSSPWVMGAAAIFSVTLCMQPVPAAAEGAGHHGGMGSMGDAGGASIGESVISGKVAETMNSGGYTYVRLEKGGKEVWVAVPAMKVKVGEEMVFSPGNPMYDFNSPSLKKTFDLIYFSPGTVTLPGTKADTKTKAAEGGAKAKGEAVKVNKAEGPDAYTVGEVYSEAAKLNNKTVRVRGKVVKVSQGILGSNWVHVQDGTGDAAKGTANLVCTTDGLPEVGDVVEVSGILSKDKDFGYGYKYDCIVEKSTIKK
ncbi:MAG: SH3-like domain-containing protein [Nitrospirae bacterium]|nr:SH3-like domain-containing protein [Nitrospirota bacterium]MBI5694275.1 SH3-like domain-containing protein [Nitrospirota bacterium]